MAAAAVTRRQLRPMASAGPRAAPKVPKAKVPSSAIRSPYAKAKTAADHRDAHHRDPAPEELVLTLRPKALGRSRTSAAEPMFTKESAVDMMAARIPAKTSPARISGAKLSRNWGDASSGLARGASRPLGNKRRHRETDAEPDEDTQGLGHSDDQRHPLELAGVVEHEELVEHVGLAEIAHSKDQKKPHCGKNRNRSRGDRGDRGRTDRTRRWSAPLFPSPPPAWSA